MPFSPLTASATVGALAVAFAATTGAACAHAAVSAVHAIPAHQRLLPPVSTPLAPGAASPRTAANTTSSNWAGYAVTGGTYTSVSSNWVQPKVTCTANGIAAFWVGLDGYGSSSVEQTGTGADCSTGSPQYFAWWETYPANSMQSYKDAVEPGDVFTSTVTSLGGGQYELDLADTTKGWAEHNKVSASGAQNASAEIVAEAVTEGENISALPDFGSAKFSGSQVDGASAAAAGAQAIDMTDAGGNVIAATGSMNQSGDFPITYQGSSSALGLAGAGAKSVPFKPGTARA